MPDSFNHDRADIDPLAGIPANEFSQRIAANLGQIKRKITPRAFHNLGVYLSESWGF